MVEQDTAHLTPAGLLFFFCMAVFTIVLPRRYALVPLLITACYMPLGQSLVVAGLNMHILRLMLLVGWLRVLSRREAEGLKFTQMDKLFLWWNGITLVVGTLTEFSVERFIASGGIVYGALGVYFLVRCWVRDFNELIGMLRVMAWLMLPLAVSMINEGVNNRNFFHIFGGVSEHLEQRDGRPRCQGSFRHPILAGTYAATLFPLFVGLWFVGGRNKRISIMGASCAAVCTQLANTSGALLGFMGAIVGLLCWKLRYHMRLIRWGIVLMLVALHFMMKAPVWFIITWISDVVGGTGWCSTHIIDMAVRNFNEWWLVGTPTTAHWAPAGQVLAVDAKNMDIINHYVAEGLWGGIWKLGLFIAMIVVGFKSVGRWAKEEAAPLPLRKFLWVFGVCLFAHCMCFFCVSYFDQIIVMWYMLLAFLSLIGEQYELREHAQELAEGFQPALETEEEAVTNLAR